MNMKQERGFTLIESLVAVAILMSLIVAFMTAVRSSVSYFIYSKEQVTAFYLAHDAMEFIKSVQITDLSNGSELLTNEPGVDNFFYDLFMAGNKCVNDSCQIDTTTGSVTVCSTAECDLLVSNNTSKAYNYDSANGSATVFRRAIEVANSGDQIEVTVTVRWTTTTGSGQFVLQRYLYDFFGAI